MIPLWLGVVPFAVAYAVTARAGGLGVLDTQLMSLVVFAGSAQFSAAGLFAQGASPLPILLTTFLLNVRHVLYGLSLGRAIPMTPVQRALGAWFMTDEAYGMTIASGASTFGFYLGAALSLYVVWNLATLAGALLGGILPDPARLGVDFVFPLAFLGLLVPLLKGRIEVVVALLAGGFAWLLSKSLPGGLVVLIVGMGGSLLGAWLTTRRKGEAS
ncbi:4-azaleucine resistance transporter AzlC [Deinococcus yavapaiensis KR-236]|uniref:4-azaleucine resistance transporter AzlC n=2 Tax=Deinococcus TaxID=1298 RepID=A0A318SA26_9DEIO|nr:4-azaleucine resistance transporter AzlC [Deinococcus yavapaiensis KR-236]